MNGITCALTGRPGGELGSLENQIARVRAEEQQRATLNGERLDWRFRLAAIMGRLGVTT